LLAVAQYDADLAARRNKALYRRPAPGLVSLLIHPVSPVSGNPCYPCEHSSVAAASSAVLAFLYPEDSAWLAGKAREHESCRVEAGANFPSDITAGDAMGRSVAALVLARARADGADSAEGGF